TARRKFWEQAFEGQVAESVFEGNENSLSKAESQLETLLQQHANNQPTDKA
ncbi:siroheme synthase, partial [Escherichia coli]|nr:siroheme synthase [Escherichia coli]